MVVLESVGVFDVFSAVMWCVWVFDVFSAVMVILAIAKRILEPCIYNLVWLFFARSLFLPADCQSAVILATL
jgi:hypothetical protein